MELKPQFDELQKIFDRCIKHACRVLEECIATKTARLDPDQRQEQERLEYNRIADELAELYLHHSVLSDLGSVTPNLHFFGRADSSRRCMPMKRKSTLHSPYPRSTTPNTSGITRPMMPNFLIFLLS